MRSETGYPGGVFKSSANVESAARYIVPELQGEVKAHDNTCMGHLLRGCSKE